MTITVKGTAYKLAIDNIPIQEKLIVRKALGLPLEAFQTEGQIGEDSLVVFWWLARRSDGETTLTWTRALDEWPTGLTPEDLTVEIDDGIPEGETSPE